MPAPAGTMYFGAGAAQNEAQRPRSQTGEQRRTASLNSTTNGGADEF